mmetsp:Transcript_4580/g.9110  ORF Transcript_4580/g.9110 Transcript_4580/m.9110 type:complete len:880 (+) Transcript_4580:51-2690(+)|eukprot:CAMPEP_0172661286 /NCGR_PEP_ID=MMETSP1074-20121228/4596_1 /TAXON_ID=2916 /ORGANISM="Ceratium fusus, Strain PA161109" /LENGTH=879 /DNA_ID=CAMNT_0013477025 /DNA_START=40 /DNA_END=2679 /DNA_ORIENTATION=+
MDFGRLQADLKLEALRAVRERSKGLLAEFSARGARQSSQADRELTFLERATAAAGDQAKHYGVSREVEVLRERFSALPLAERLSVGSYVRSLSTGDTSPHADTVGADKRNSRRLSATTRQAETPSHSGGAVELKEMTSDSATDTGNLPNIAVFLFPELPSNEAKDEVRILALGDGLVQALLRHSFMTSFDSNRTFFLRNRGPDSNNPTLAMREAPTGDSCEGDPLTGSCIGLSFNELGVQLVTAKADARERNRSRERLTQALELAVGILGHVPGVGAGLAAAASGAVIRGSKITIEKWQDHVLKEMHKQLPRTLQPLPEDEILQLQAVGREAEKALLKALAEGPSWRPWRLSRQARKLELPLFWRQSALRGRGCAFQTHFPVQSPARFVYTVLQNLSVSGSLDLDCKAMWARPVDDQGTSMRYVVFSSNLTIRDFFLIARLAKTDGRGPVACLPGYAQSLLSDEGVSSSCGSCLAARSCPVTNGPWEQRLPPATRNRTSEFQSLRGKQTDGTAEAQWRERLRETLAHSNPSNVRRLRDAGLTAQHSNVLNLKCDCCCGLLGGSATVCDVCHRKLCLRCGSKEEDVAPLLGGGKVAAKQRLCSPLLLVCCADCQHFIDTLRWQWVPSLSLSTASTDLQRLYEELAASMTQLVTAMAQLDGLQILCSSNASPHPALSEIWAQLGPSRDAANAAWDALESALGDLDAFEAPTDRMRLLRDNLWKHGKDLRDRCKRSLITATKAAQECEANCPSTATSATGIWTASSRPAERYAFCETSCPQELLHQARPGALPVPDQGIAHGCIKMLGVVATDMPEGGSRVDIVADVDPKMYSSFVVDRQVRHRVLNAAARLRQVVYDEQRLRHEEDMNEIDGLLSRLQTEE